MIVIQIDYIKNLPLDQYLQNKIKNLRADFRSHAISVI